MLKGEKVLLRPVKKSDIQYFLKWFNDLEVSQYLARYLPMTEIAEEKWIEEMCTKGAERNVFFVIEATDNGQNQPIGSMGLSNINYKDRKAVFGIVIGEKDYWSMGYGTEAGRLIIEYGFKQLNLNRISSCAYDFNERSLKLHKKLRFVCEGSLRKAAFINGEYRDEIMFGLLREDWNG